MNDFLNSMQKKYLLAYLYSVLSVIAIFVYFAQPFFHHWLIFVALCIVLICVINRASEKRKEYKVLCFEIAYKEAFEEHFEEVLVDKNPEEEVQKEVLSQIADTNLKETAHNVESTITTTAVYKGMNVKIHEIQLFDLIQQDKHSKPEKKLKGERWFMTVDLPKKFMGEVQIHTFPSMPYKKWLQKLQFEDVDFNRNFEVFATSEMDGFRLLTPKIIRNFVDVADGYANRGKYYEVDMCFRDGTFAITTEELNTMIYVPMWGKFDTEKAKKKVGKIVSWVKTTIDDYKLDSAGYITGR